MVAAITGAASAIGVLGAAWFAFRGKRGETKVSEIAQIMEGYRDIVATLQAEIKRLEERIETLVAEQEECDRRNTAMQAQIEHLKNEIALWSGKGCP
jgi:peptidoglycan hydrolase CwlO-like protein